MIHHESWSIMALEVLALIATIIGVIGLYRRGRFPGVTEEVRPIVVGLLLLTGLSHACDVLEWSGHPWGDRLGDAFSVFRPAVWIFLLFSLGRAILMQRVRFQEQQLRFFLEQTPAAVAVLDRDLRYLALSHRWRESYHPSLEGPLEGRDASALDVGISPLLMEIAERCLRGLGPAAEAEPRRVLLGGQEHWIRWAASPWMRGERDVGGVVILAELVTEEVRQEELLRDAQQELMHANRLDTVGVIAGGVAHDIRNFLMAISGHATLLDDPTVTEEEARASLAAIQLAVSASTEILEALTRMSRRHEASTRLEVCGFLRQTQRLLSHFLPRSVRLRLELPEAERVYIQTPQIQLQQVFLNLAVNARDAMPDGGALTLSLDIEPSSEGPFACISVIDTGVGIPPEIQARIFEPLFTTKPAGEGTGLGLAIVSQIVEDAGGVLELRSAPGEGTTFSLRFPCQRERVAAS